MILRFAKESVRRSARRIGLPSVPASIASASSISKTRAVNRRKLRGARLAMTRPFSGSDLSIHTRS